MERKVTEWGCMQALIDFDGWRKWKAYAIAKENEDPAKKAAEEKEEKAKARAALKAMFAKPPPASAKKESGEKTPTTNGTGKKTPPGGNPRMHRNSRSVSTSGSLESMMEVDEKN